MKKIVILILIILLFVNTINVFADEITVKINGEALYFDVKPQIVNGRTMVPMRKIFEALGANVTWDPETKTAIGENGNDKVNITLNSDNLIKNGNTVKLDVPPMIIECRTLVPVRAIAESFNCYVCWCPEDKTVEIIKMGENSSNKKILNASEIAEKASEAVFYIEIYDKNYNAVSSGSGFFISSDGLAVTNFHVVSQAKYAKIYTTDGSVYSIDNLLYYDEELDIALFKINYNVRGFSYLKIADSDKIKAGQTVYALGSPQGLQNTISNGIISNVSQKINATNYIQITAPISHGSSGGALMNEYGDVIGITSAGIDEAQNIGFAIPINMLKFVTSQKRNTKTSSDSVANTGSFREKSNVNFKIKLSHEKLRLYSGESEIVKVMINGADDYYRMYYGEDNSEVATCQWLGWIGNSMTTSEIQINAHHAGTTLIRVSSDVNDVEKIIEVTVVDKQMYEGIDVEKLESFTSAKLKSSDVEKKVYVYEFTDGVYEYIKQLNKNFTKFAPYENTYGVKYTFAVGSKYFYVSLSKDNSEITIKYESRFN